MNLASSLPHRQLRKNKFTLPGFDLGSLPHRQLRKPRRRAPHRARRSLPHRQLRKAMYQTAMAHRVFTAAQAAQKVLGEG